MSLTSFVDYLQLERKYSKHTVLAYKKDAEAFFAFAKAQYAIENPADVSYGIVRSWIVVLSEQGVENRSINRKIASLKAFYKFLQKIEEVQVSPLAKHKALKIKKEIQIPFSANEVKAALDSVIDDGSFEILRDRLLIELFYATGMRRSELISLKLHDVDLSNDTLKVLGKRNKERIIPIIKSLKETLLRYLEVRKAAWPASSEVFLLLTDQGVKLYDTFVYRTINNYFSKVSEKVKTSPHMLRHTFATHLLNEGADLNSVKELLGHSSLAATQVYTHNNMAELGRIYKSAHPRNKNNTQD